MEFSPLLWTGMLRVESRLIIISRIEMEDWLVPRSPLPSPLSRKTCAPFNSNGRRSESSGSKQGWRDRLLAMQIPFCTSLTRCRGCFICKGTSGSRRAVIPNGLGVGVGEHPRTGGVLRYGGDVCVDNPRTCRSSVFIMHLSLLEVSASGNG